jgi:DnaJ-class molecular chaperone with C-terminal Zn finger domain
MNLKDAYSILELPQTATPEEAKKKFRELTKKYHPDVSKEKDAEAKFKKINEAYQVVSSGKSTDREELSQQQSHWDPFGFSQQRVVRQPENVTLSATISFKDSVFGVKKEIKYNRRIKCQNCGGQGEFALNNGCDKCGGRGQIVGRQGNMIFTRTCDKCQGKTQIEECKNCSGEGGLISESTVSVNVPGGIQDSNVLRLQGMGNYIMTSFGMMDQYTDAFLQIKVTPEKGLSLVGQDVVCYLEIPLLDALRGCTRTVNTILGNKEVKVDPRSRNKDEIILPNLGVNRTGNQRVILDVKYPSDVGQIINVLA